MFIHEVNKSLLSYMNQTLSRRELVTAGVTVGSVALAGCADDPSSETDGDETTDSESDTDEDTVGNTTAENGTASSEESETPPQIAFDYEFQGEAECTLIHSGGDRAEASQLAITVGDEAVFPEPTSEWEISDGWSETVQADDELTLTDTGGTNRSGEEVRIFWTDSTGEAEQTLSTRTWP